MKLRPLAGVLQERHNHRRQQVIRFAHIGVMAQNARTAKSR
jgi:hypothetical protein